MEITTTLSLIVGFTSFLNALAMLFNKNEVQKIFHDVSNNRSLIFIMGMIMSGIGVTLLVVLPTSGGVLNILLGLFGVMLIGEGALFMLTKHDFLKKYFHTMQNTFIYYTIAAAYLILSLFLIF